MTTYNLPNEPSGPVWDKEGNKWERVNEHYWETDTAAHTWAAILEYYGPLTDTPPVKVGDKVTLNEFSEMPEASVAGGPWDVYIKYSERVYTDAQVAVVDLSEYGDDVVTVLRVGDGVDER